MATRSALVLAVVAVGAPLAFGQSRIDPCAAMLGLADRTRADGTYARRAGGYCDGAVYERNAGRGDLLVVGVTRTPISGRPPLRLIARGAAGAPAGSIRVQGVALDSGVNYRLDGVLGPDGSLVVGADSALYRHVALSADQVGWSAWSDAPDTGQVFHPLDVAGESSVADVAIAVRPTMATAYLYYSMRDAHGVALGSTTMIRESSDPGVVRIVHVPHRGRAHYTVVVTAVGVSGRTQVAVIALRQEAS